MSELPLCMSVAVQGSEPEERHNPDGILKLRSPKVTLLEVIKVGLRVSLGELGMYGRVSWVVVG